MRLCRLSYACLLFCNSRDTGLKEVLCRICCISYCSWQVLKGNILVRIRILDRLLSLLLWLLLVALLLSLLHDDDGVDHEVRVPVAALVLLRLETSGYGDEVTLGDAVRHLLTLLPYGEAEEVLAAVVLTLPLARLDDDGDSRRAVLRGLVRDLAHETRCREVCKHLCLLEFCAGEPPLHVDCCLVRLAENADEVLRDGHVVLPSREVDKDVRRVDAEVAQHLHALLDTRPQRR